MFLYAGFENSCMCRGISACVHVFIVFFFRFAYYILMTLFSALSIFTDYYAKHKRPRETKCFSYLYMY